MGPKSSKPPRAPPQGTVSSQDRAVLDLKNARDRLTRYSRSLEAAEVRLLERAKGLHREGKKDRAVMLMKLKVRKGREARAVEDQLLQVLSMVETLQWSAEQERVVGALREGKEALRRMHDRVSVDDVLSLMDDVEEGRREVEEIGDALAQLGEGDSLEEEEVEREIEQMVGEMEGETEKKEGGESYKVEDLPDVPITMPIAPKGGLEKEKVEVEEKEKERVAVSA